MSSDQLLGYAKAWAQTAQWKPEAGAKINLLRWKRFVEAEDVAFMKIVDAFQKATGVTITVSNESYDDISAEGVGRRQYRAGPGHGVGPLFVAVPVGEQVLDIKDVADYLGGKTGGWTQSGKAYGKLDGKWVGIPIAATGGLVNYRIAAAKRPASRSSPRTPAASPKCSRD